MWVVFSKDFDWRQERRVTIVYKAGMRLSVTRACGAAAIAAGAAQAVETPAIDDPARGGSDGGR